MKLIKSGDVWIDSALIQGPYNLVEPAYIHGNWSYTV